MIPEQTDNFSKIFGKRRGRDIFVEVLETLHEKGEFGDMPFDVIVEHQADWYSNFTEMIFENNIMGLRDAMLDRSNVITRGWFSKLTGFNVKHFKKDAIDNMLREFVQFRTKKHDISNFGKYMRHKGYKE